jgi:multidrug efflux pump subunit AcrB
MGVPLTLISLFGVVALAGVVVNDSLLMVDFINRKRVDAGSLAAAAREAGMARFRPILLTSLTTFAGLLPIIIDNDIQARSLVPMAISLAFGVVFATVITLILVPAGYVIVEDGRRLLSRKSEGDAATSQSTLSPQT